MSDDPALSDDQVYDLLHDALLSFSHRTVATSDGQAILSTAIRQIEVLQRALIILKEGDGSTAEHPHAT
jgi:hypothetical protein